MVFIQFSHYVAKRVLCVLTVLCFVCFAPLAHSADTVTINFLYTADLHGHVYPGKDGIGLPKGWSYVPDKL